MALRKGSQAASTKSQNESRAGVDSDDDSSDQDGGAACVQCVLPQEASNKSFKCEICELMYSSGAVTNAGSRDYPRYRCRGCHAASRWLDKSLASKGVNVAERKRRHFAKYQKHCVQFRVWKAGDPIELKEHGVGSNKHRYVVWIQFEKSIRFEIFTEEGTQVCYLNQRQFLGYHVTFELYTRPEAEELWRRALEAPTFANLKNRQQETVIPVALPDFARSGTRNSEVGTKRKIERNDSNASSDDDAFEDYVDQKVKRAKVQGSATDDVVRANVEKIDKLVSEKPVGAPLKLKGPAEAPPQGALTETNVRSLDDGKSVRSGASKVLSMLNVSKDEDFKKLTLTKARTEVKSIAKKMRTQLWKNKNCDVQVLTALLTKIPTDNLEVASTKPNEKIQEFDGKLSELENLSGLSDQWVDGSYLKKYKEFKKACEEVVKLGEELSTILASLKDVRLSSVREVMYEGRKLGLKIRNHFRPNPLPVQGFPATAVTWLGGVVLNLSVETDEKVEIGVSTGVSEIQDEASEVDWKKITLFRSASNHAVNKQVMTGFDESSELQPKVCTDDCSKAFAENPKGRINMMRCKVNKCAESEAAPWLPAELQGKGLKFVRGAGVPWIYASQNFGFRSHDHIALPTCASLYSCQEGEVVFLAIDLSHLVTDGSTVPDCTLQSLVDMLNGLSPAVAGDWMSKNCDFFSLKQGDVVFFPYGTIVWMVDVSGSKSFIMHMPLFCDDLVDKNSTIIKPMDDQIKIFFDNAKKPWKKLASVTKLWFDQFEQA